MRIAIDLVGLADRRGSSRLHGLVRKGGPKRSASSAADARTASGFVRFALVVEALAADLVQIEDAVLRCGDAPG